MSEVKTGFMHKCGKSVKSWKRRWFVLRANGYLYYYDNKSCTHEKGKIDIVDAQRISTWFDVSTAERKLPNGMSPDRAFAIVCNDRTYTCVCEIDGESQSWINALNKVRGGEQQYPQPTHPKEGAKEQEQPKFEAPPPYTPTSGHPRPTSAPQMPQPHNYGGFPPPIGVPTPQPQPYTQNAATLPRPGAGAPPPQPAQRCNSFDPAAGSSPRTASFVPSPPTSGVRHPPPGGPGYTHSYPVGSYQPQAPPNPNYYPPRPMPQPGYPPVPVPQQPVGYPPRLAYPPGPPPAAAYPPRPPPSAYPPRPMQPMYRSPPAPYQPPLRPAYQCRPHPPAQQYRPAQQSAANVTVINLAAPAQTTRIVYR